jgi:DNA-directed RNA polymerase subunit RPC12/RpoP
MHRMTLDGFICIHCQKEVKITKSMGTANRNHCPSCLYSKHVDEKAPGDRKSNCLEEMQPVALTFKKEGGEKQGEIMLVHLCQSCGKININRIAADDEEKEIMYVFSSSQYLKPGLKEKLIANSITALAKEDQPQVLTQLFGKNFTKKIDD